MDTSRSSDAQRRCVATATVFSGRPDPEWQVRATTVRDLEKLWDQLEVSGSRPAAPAPLGYRGCTLDCGTDARWFAYRGTVSKGGEHRSDPQRRFERALLRCAPPGLIPQAVLAEIG
jgi:hypothetical protein